MKITISFYTGYGEDKMIHKSQFNAAEYPPIPRIGEKVVIHGDVYVVSDVVNYFESNYEVAVIIRREENVEHGGNTPEISKNKK